MAVILVTGSDGQLGNELKVASKNYYGYDFHFTDVKTLDITDRQQIEEYVRNLQPDWVINCAAYNLVDRAENEPEAAMLVNSIAVRNIADAVRDTECRFIHLSTDYVYAGTGCTPYDENSEPNPMSAYGKSKLTGERSALTHPWTMVIRTSWLYSSFGNNFVKTILRNAREKGMLNVVFDQTGSPTYAADLAEAIMIIVSGVIRNQIAFNAGVYNFSNEGACTWYDFAVEIVKESGVFCIVNPVLSNEFSQLARRPSYSVMDKSKIKENYSLKIPHWRESLIRCIKLLEK